MVFLCYPNCTTCKKAQQFLEASGMTFSVRDIKSERPTYEELKLWHQQSGLPLKRFFNTSGSKYRELKLKDRLPQMSEEEQLQLLASDGMLVKRPILLTERGVLVGFRQSEWEEDIS